MSQIDKVIYLPLLIWFILLFILFYIFVFSYFLKCFLITFRTRNLFLCKLIGFSRTCFLIIELFNSFCKDIWTSKFYKNLYLIFYKRTLFFQYYFKSLINISSISISVILFSPLEQFDVIGFLNLSNQAPLFFNVLVPFILLFGIFTYIFTLNSKELNLIPGIFQRLFEIVIEFIFNLIKQQIGKEGYILFPFIFTLFNFILFTNLLSLIPFGIALTSHLIMILWLSLSICLSIFFLGLYIHNIQFLKIFIPECPILLLPMLIVIEIFSYVIRAFSLAIRLSANIMAGHTLVFIISSFITNMIVNTKYGLFFIGFTILLAVLILELGVAFLQAYVFTVLVCIYLNDALKGPSH